MKKKLGIMLSTSVFTFSGFGMELQQDVSSTKSSTVTVQTAMTKDMEDKSAEQMAEIQKLLETQIQAAQVEVDFVNSTIKYCKPSCVDGQKILPKQSDLFLSRIIDNTDFSKIKFEGYPSRKLLQLSDE